MSNKLTTLNLLRKFLAGFVSIIPVLNTKVRGYPFTRPEHALDKDWLDIGNDIETINKNKHARK